MTSVTTTGTGTPILRPGVAGPGVLVRHRDVALQFDAGRATSLRIVEAGLPLEQLQAVFVTHHHSDHLVGLAELLIDRWMSAPSYGGHDPLEVYVPDGPGADIAEHVLDVWQEEIRMRLEHNPMPHRPEPKVVRFAASDNAIVVFDRDGVRVSAVLVAHDPVVPAVAYRVDTPAGSVAVSGDTAVCTAVEDLAAGVDVLVHEAFSRAGASGIVSDVDRIGAYHADTRELGAMARRSEPKTLVLTHLIPPLDGPGTKDAFEAEIRAGGFKGTVIVAEDLTTVELPLGP